MTEIADRGDQVVSVFAPNRLPVEEAKAAEVERVASAASALMVVLYSNNWTRERLELPSALDSARQSSQAAGYALKLLSAMQRPATCREVREHLAILMGCLAGSKADAEVFGRMLVIDVGALSPSIGALEAACRNLRRTSTFTPSIAEVLQALTEAEKQLTGARWRLEQLPRLIAEAESRLQQRLRADSQWAGADPCRA